MSYLELSIKERDSIQTGKAQGMSLRHITQLLGEPRKPSLVKYAVTKWLRKVTVLGTPNVSEKSVEWFVVLHISSRVDLIMHMLRRCLSLEQISGKLKTIKLPYLRYAYLYRETIHTAIYALPVGYLRKELILCLRQGKTTCKPCRGEVDRRGQIPRMFSIHLRLPVASKRKMPSHWEGDLIKGKNNASAIGTLVELSSGNLILAKMDAITVTSALAGSSAALNRMPITARKSMAYDQGREMAQHAKITQETCVAIYFFRSL